MSKYGFKVPVSGQKIPHGWFAALVRFMNSLILSGDGRYTMVDRNESGTSVTLTPAVIDALNKASGGPSGPAAPAAPQHLTVDVSGNTATVALSGSTSAVEFVGTGDVTLSGNTNGQIEINATGGTASYPDWGSMNSETITLVWSADYSTTDPYSLTHSGYLKVSYNPSFALKEDNSFYAMNTAAVLVDGEVLFSYGRYFYLSNYGASIPQFQLIDSGNTPDRLIPVRSGSVITAEFNHSGGTDTTPPLELTLYYFNGYVPPENYTVTNAAGTSRGSLFYGLSQQGDISASVDSSLDGTPIDFEGASVL